jgi:hypothetical protein
MKMTFKFFGALLIAGSLTFASCEKDDLSDPEETTEQEIGQTGNENSDSTKVAQADSSNQKEEGAEKKVVCFQGKLIKKDDNFMIIQAGLHHQIVGNQNILNQHLERCVDICTIKVRDNENGGVFEMTEIKPCKEDRNGNQGIKKCLKGILKKDDKGRFGIIIENVFHRLSGRENDLKPYLHNGIEVCGFKLKDNEGDFFDVIDIKPFLNPEGSGNEGHTLEGKLQVIEGKMGIMKNNKFNELKENPNRPIQQHLGAYIKVKVILIAGTTCKYEVLEIYEKQ